MYVALEIPNECLTTQDAALICGEVKLSYALWLFRQARVTISKAAQLAGLPLYDFMAACKVHEVSVINITEQELIQEVFESSARLTELRA